MTAARPRLLLADDDAVLRAMVGASLETAGFDVIEARDGEVALAAFEADRPDLLILDMLMPRMGGLETCRAVREKPLGQHVPILVLTSRDDPESISAAYAAGATDFVTKGLSHRLLAERARFLLRSDAWRAEGVAQRRRLALVQDLARVGHWELDGEGRTLDVSDIIALILGTPLRELDHFDRLLDIVDDDSQALLAAARDDWRRHARTFRLDARLRSGAYLSIHGAPGAQPEQAMAGGLMLSIQDTSELHDARDRAERLLHEDPVTGLPNRTHINESLAEMLNGRRRKSSLAVIALRILGHDRGSAGPGRPSADDLLRTAAERVQRAASSARARILLGHLGNGTMIALADNVSTPEAAEEAAKHLLNALQRPIEGSDWQVALTSHAGVSLWPADGEGVGDLIAAAQAACDAAQGSRTDCRRYSPDIHVAAQRRADLEVALRRAIRDGLLSVVYQPRIDLSDQRLLGVEALLRMQHPKLGAISPAEFIPIAEGAGLIVELGEWVLQTACVQAEQWRKTHHRHVAVSVNVSAEQLHLGDEFAVTVRAALSEARLPPEALELELTESMIIHANDASLGALQNLRALGVAVALDDFGTGYSALGLLSRLPVDCLKIDRSFVATLETEPAARGITEAILAMARSLRIRTVAEGIETPAQLALLRENGCNEGQGFLISKPVPAAEIDRLLSLPAMPIGQRAQLQAV